jgi:hypothetical protein
MRNSFTDRMAHGRELAQVARNRGQQFGRNAPGWKYCRPTNGDRNTWAWLTQDTRQAWQSAKRAAVNDYRAACLNSPDDDLGAF